MKQEVLQLELVLGSYGNCKLSHTFPMEKLFNYSPSYRADTWLLRICGKAVPVCN